MQSTYIHFLIIAAVNRTVIIVGLDQMDSIFQFPPTGIFIEDCISVLTRQRLDGVLYDAIITDPPYELGLHGINWDQTGISFSAKLWDLLYSVLKPGGYLAAFSASRLYHRMAVAAEDAGFSLYPFIVWKYPGGVPKPANVSELFDRDNLPERTVIGYRPGSGYTKSNVDHGAQNRNTTQFPIYERHVSQEARDWRGYYYGVNAMMPCMEPIMLAQKPIDQSRTIDNLRVWRTGALNLGIMKDRHGGWPTTVLEHPKAKKHEHKSNHPSVKPVGLLEDLCLMLCPPGGLILDPFAGTGTTGVAAQHCSYPCHLIEQNPLMEVVIRQRLGL